MTILKKVKWALGISVVFLLIITTNLVDRNNFESVKQSVSTIYEDRLVAKDLVFKISLLIQEKEIAHAVSGYQFGGSKSKAIDKKIETLLVQFEATKLTETEDKTFKALKANLIQLQEYESTTAEGQVDQTDLIQKQLEMINNNLFELSKIQLEEGKRQMYISQKAVNTVELFTQIEICFLIILAILIQIIVMYKPKDGEEEYRE